MTDLYVPGHIDAYDPIPAPEIWNKYLVSEVCQSHICRQSDTAIPFITAEASRGLETFLGGTP